MAIMVSAENKEIVIMSIWKLQAYIGLNVIKGSLTLIYQDLYEDKRSVLATQYAAFVS